MEEILNNLKRNPTMLYFLIIFAVVWIGGMLWAVVLVIKSLSKTSRSRRKLRSMGFAEVVNRRDMIEAVKDICKRTLCSNLANRVELSPRAELLRVESDNKKVVISYELPKSEYRELPRAVGLKEQIQIVSRKMVLKRILYRSSGRGAFYAGMTDVETIRAYKPAERISSVAGWVLCFSADTKVSSQITMYRKFTGHRKLLMGLALKIAQVKPVELEGLLDGFSEEFEVAVADVPESGEVLDKAVQRKILDYKDAIPEGTKLYLNREGVWLVGDTSVDSRQMERIVELCEQLIDAA